VLRRIWEIDTWDPGSAGAGRQKKVEVVGRGEVV
jgi:hypothetical protein